MMKKDPTMRRIPLWTVMREGGPGTAAVCWSPISSVWEGTPRAGLISKLPGTVPQRIKSGFAVFRSLPEHGVFSFFRMEKSL